MENDTETKKQDEQKAEFYFIQFIYCSNPYLLQKQFRPLLDKMFEKYLPIFLDGRKNHLDLEDINTKFKNSL